jgi:hypothetical protein
VRFVPLNPEPVRAAWRLAVAVKPARDEKAEPFVVIRSGLGLRVYLGASIDAAGRVVELLEIWIQSVAGLAGSTATWRHYISNQQLDREWATSARQFAEATPDACRLCGWEESHPEPVFIDVERGESWSPVDAASGLRFQLCTDDALLRAAGLPAYSESLHRYWHVRQQGESVAVTWVAATPGAPDHPQVRTRDSILPLGRNLVPLNPEGGLMQVHRLAPIGLEDYINLLSGAPWRGLAAGAGPVMPPGVYSNLSDWDRLLQDDGNLFLHGRTRSGMLAETFYLRLQLIYQMVQAVGEAVARRKLPMLNLSTESFRVEMGPTAPGLPLLWSARASLVVPGSSVALPIQATDLRHFMPVGVPATTIFRPEFLGLPARGRCLVRLRRVSADTAGQISVEGTIVTSERLKLTPQDLLWLKMAMPGLALDLFARCDAAEGLASGECRFRTEPQRFEPEAARLLRASEGNSFEGTEYETVPMLSTPCDLYALGVLAVRTLLVNPQNSLGVALDETLSLARQMGLETVEGGAADRVRSLVAADSRWLASMGPHRLSHEPTTPEAVFAAVPEELWWRAMGVVARMFPGQGPDSYCRDFSDASPFAVEKVFGAPLADLASLLRCARGLLFSDWAANREVAGVLARLRA